MLDPLDILGSLDVADLAAAERRENLIDYVIDSLPGYQAGWFHRDVCARLERFSAAVARGESPRLIIEAPPRHGKSFMASERFPCWHMGKHPDHEIVVAGYGLAIAQDRTKAARDLAVGDYHRSVFPEFEVSRDTAAKANWQLQGKQGSLRAVGRSGPLTGRGAHILILDDLVKDYADALSPLQRDAVWNWYLSTAYTRLAPGGGIIIIMTRWHEDDLAGRVQLEQAKENWEVVSYPAIAERREPHRQPGDALHPDRFPIEALEKIKTALGSHVFGALYQQRPTSPGGTVWRRDWFKYWTRDKVTADAHDNYITAPAKWGQVIQSWDLTFKKTERGSFVVGQVWAKRGADYYLLDEVRGRWGFVETKAQILALQKRWKNTRKILIEDKANGPAIMDALRGDLGRKIKAVEPDGSKEARAHAVAGMIEAGNVYLPADAVWVDDWLDECSSFPTAPNDDRVDCAGQALRYMSKSKPVLIGHL